MQISQETVDKINWLSGQMFSANACLDNLAYNLGHLDLPHMEEIVHSKVAHAAPLWADVLSDLLLEFDARPIRLPVQGFNKDYQGDVVAIFEDMYSLMNELLNDTKATIDVAELNDDVEVKLELEDFLEDLVPYAAQARLWLKTARRYVGNEVSFDIHFAQFTNINED